ncbi:hypothetical protein [Zooshikella ganghwensis]|uniref:Uncharacterized protein n=1 Tax=Zooshikella ganghwensis TaxID=202772 RepID=A0A4P9VHT2_9GAMM|nr:hypothetical protein [Zooshikella ganghwensis]RDH42745.1 hypothetical protein B9G39_04370 [Zooshikella ganghwensis]
MISRQQMMAGKIFKDKLNRILVLSPLPIETQHTAHDGARIIKAKTDVYLDIGHKSVREGAENLALGINIVNLISIVICSSPYWMFNSITDSYFPIYFLLSILAGTHFLYFQSIIRNYFSLKKFKFIRFNRQRREVALPFTDTQDFVIIPWEKLYAWAGTSMMITESTAIPLSTLTITIASPTDATDFKGRYEVAGGEEINCIMQWECIRAFMEDGSDACPDPSKVNTLAEYKAARRQMRKELGPWQWIKQKLIDWLHYSYFAHWLSDWHEKKLPKVTIPENIKRWSEPIPEDQWQQPSDELIEANFLAHDFYDVGGHLGDVNMPVYDPRKKVTFNQQEKKPDEP